MIIIISCHVLGTQIYIVRTQNCVYFGAKKNNVLGCFSFLFNHYYEISVILQTKVPVACYMCKDLSKMTVVHNLHLNLLNIKQINRYFFSYIISFCVLTFFRKVKCLYHMNCVRLKNYTILNTCIYFLKGEIKDAALTTQLIFHLYHHTINQCNKSLSNLNMF